MAVLEQMPRWDLSPLFPSIDAPEFSTAFKALRDRIAQLEATFADARIGEGEVSDDPAQTFERCLSQLNEVMESSRPIGAFIHALVTTDSRNDAAKAAESELDLMMVSARKVSVRFTAWIGEQDVDELLNQSEMARAHEYALRKAKVSATHLMPSELESLASDLDLTGKSAWAKLYGNVTSQIMVPIHVRGEDQSLVMSAIRGLAYDPDREVRRTAQEAELAAWKQNETPLAAAMNSIKGEVLTLCGRRGWTPRSEACFASNIDEATLDAMLAAAQEAFPTFRRYLRAKAKRLGIDQLAFFDLFAPLPGASRSWEYGEAMEFVKAEFGGYSGRLQQYAARAFAENWVDAPPAPGKRDGAYCMGVRGDQSRILMNFKPSFGSVSTLAHELGHGYHNYCLAGRTWTQRSTPMTLAETASIFCETILRQGVLEHGSPEDQLAVLEGTLQGSTQVVVDITSRYLFELRTFEARASRELSGAELCAIMKQAQIDTYGDGLDVDQLHPYMWAAKPHYYAGRSFYNFPYMFGLLFGLGLYDVYRRQPDGFHERYDNLLSSTGLADAATLGERFGIDIRSIEFWRGSLSQIAADVDRYEAV